MEQRGCQREEERFSGHYLLGKRERQKLVYFLIQAATMTAGKNPSAQVPHVCPGAPQLRGHRWASKHRTEVVTATFSVLSSVKLEGGGAS